MMLWTVSVFAAVIPLAASFPTYALPEAFTKSLLAEASCSLPEVFTIRDFQTWAPAEGDKASMTIQFGYADNTTGIQTNCQYNSTSKNVAKAGRTVRYACDNSLVQFIWQEDTLTMIESVCPGASE